MRLRCMTASIPEANPFLCNDTPFASQKKKKKTRFS